MYFPDNVAGLTALSERVHGFVLRWRTAIGRKLRRPAEHSPRPRRNGGVSALCERGRSADRGVPRWNPWGATKTARGLAEAIASNIIKMIVNQDFSSGIEPGPLVD
jgi:hypothetical protein